jgi:hypothetical protein
MNFKSVIVPKKFKEDVIKSIDGLFDKHYFKYVKIVTSKKRLIFKIVFDTTRK